MKTRKPTSMERTSSSERDSDVTIILYSYGQDAVPFKSRLPGKNITLRQFKAFIHKKGNFRYFFKTFADDIGLVLEEALDDNEVLPLYRGKVFGVMETVDSSSDDESDELLQETIRLGQP
ncbi:hypothetical protein AVEN_239660-1 [Araneus ventricosus]|uniref:DIX domain-containing protein n=1 Tax=Araneus ventricosus TaxID=182803 RepID=A0A4Y2CR72_ARAVE|nr:hypothetical protein AVEN_239660-1 [Araneus ventricosus]